ncbi:glycosyltransferase family A protein [Nocardioides salarius]|uniref:glycosyltransferase family 2 protein n=1 Tax=Nocardioides salarius TaxID=374513 RepID=UPI0030F69625
MPTAHENTPAPDRAQEAAASQPWPSVGVVVPTRDRPELLRRALAAVEAQTYPGALEVVVVHDGAPLDTSLVRHGPRPVRVVSNERTPGLAGARNTGIMSLGTDLVAFCDDDDHWMPDKLTTQVRRALAPDRPEMVTCSITVDYDGRRNVRRAGRAEVTHAELTRSIMTMLHSSCMLFDRTALVERIGLVEEDLPGSQNEDWDLKLRASRRRPIAHVDEPLTVVDWGRPSHYAREWDTKISSWEWMLAHHPEIARDRRGAARVHGQLAFAEAARGHRRDALRWAGRALRSNPLQWRAALALAVVCGLSPDRVLDVLHRFGRGV